MKKAASDTLSVYRRRLPHWRKHGATYFVTWCMHPFQADLEAQERELVVQSLRHFDDLRYELSAYVVMNDHVHTLVTPREAHPLETIIHGWKSYTAYQMRRVHQRHGRIWQDEYFDRLIRDEHELLRTVGYILNNARRRWPDWKDYPWVGLRSFLN